MVPLATASERLPGAYGASQLVSEWPESDHKKVFVKDFSNVQIVGEGHLSGYKSLTQQLKTWFSSRLNS